MTPGVDSAADAPDLKPARQAVALRVATFNTSLWREESGQLASELAAPGQSQPARVAEVLRRVRPDVVLLNEFDWDADGVALDGFKKNYLEAADGFGEPLTYEYALVVESNTGVGSGKDFDNNGAVASEPGSRDWGNDAFGYGTFPGQYAFVVLSKYPIDEAGVRDFREFLWADMPDSKIPPGWFDEDESSIFRLSSKSHVDVPIDVGGRTLHLLASHPTPPAFDGDEERNKRRNNDEVRLWLDYITPEKGDYLVDGAGVSGGLGADEAFVIVGDLNVDPVDGNDDYTAIRELIASPRVTDTEPESQGAVAASEKDGQANTIHKGRAALDTADFSDFNVGNRRVDFALPSSNMTVKESGVFWPAPGEDGEDLAKVSDHHLVWVDLEL